MAYGIDENDCSEIDMVSWAQILYSDFISSLFMGE